MNAMDGWYCAFNALEKYIEGYIDTHNCEPPISNIRAYIHGAMTGYKEGGKE